MAVCKFDCGVNDLHWKIVDGKYRLFNSEHIMHICKNGGLADRDLMVNATKKIVNTLGLDDASQIPVPNQEKKKVSQSTIFKSKPKDDYFTITTTSSGIAITGDDKANPIYIPKVGIRGLAKALLEFI